MNIIVKGNIDLNKTSKVNETLQEAGFKNFLIDINDICSPALLEKKEKYFEELKKESDDIFLPNEPEKLVERLENTRLSTTIVKAPTLLPETKRDDLDFLIHRLTVESMRLAKHRKAKYVIVEPLVKNIRNKDDLNRNKEFYLSLVNAAKDFSVEILIKNIYDIFNGHMRRGRLGEAHELTDFIDKLNKEAGFEAFGLCLDIGVCNILGQNMYDFCETLGERIKAVIVRENNGIEDTSLLPFTVDKGRQSKLDWLNLIRGLRLIDYDGLVIFDFNDTLFTFSHILWPEVCVLAKKTADFITWQLSIEKTIKKYDTRVLFGAGNMCRNYMKCYGEKYRPLFTCDNNKSIWGTTFESLEIKNPEELKMLPKDCAIFICNIYYDEIEVQLREMGIKNPIERYNDEYLPSMYTDRFDSEKREVR